MAQLKTVITETHMSEDDKDKRVEEVVSSEEEIVSSEEEEVVSSEEGGSKKSKKQVKQKLDKKRLTTLSKTSKNEDEYFTILKTKDYSEVYDFISKNKFVSNEMKSITKEFKKQLESKKVCIKDLSDLCTKLLSYYKLNSYTLGLQYYNMKVKSDIDNIKKVLKSFVIKNRSIISENTKHVLLEKKSNNEEYTTVLQVGKLELFDIFEHLSLNNLKEVLSNAETVFTDIYISWVLILILATSLDDTDYVCKDPKKKSVIDSFKGKISLLNTDTINPNVKSLLNVLKKEKVVKPKVSKSEMVSEEDLKKIKNMQLDDKKATTSSSKKKKVDKKPEEIKEEIENDFKAGSSDEEDEVNDGDFVM